LSKLTLKHLSPSEVKLILDILDSERYPKSVRDIRSKLKITGRDIPEYLITRSLRSLLLEGKVHFKRGRWISESIKKQLETPSLGFSEKDVNISSLSNTANQILKFDKSEKTTKNIKKVSRSGDWGTFRLLIDYYIECLRSEEGADASSFVEDIGKNYIFANGIGNWYPRTGDSWSYIIPMGNHIAEFQKKLTKQLDNVVVLGYPVEAVHIKKTGQPDTRLIRPVFQYLLKQDFSDNSIKLHTKDAQPELSLQWIKYSMKNYSEQYHFLSHCGLVNSNRFDDMPLGFTSEDNRPNLDDLVTRLSSFMPKRINELLSPRSLNSNPLPTSFKAGIYNRAVIMIGNRTKYTQTLIKELTHIRDQEDEVLNKTSLKYLFKKNESIYLDQLESLKGNLSNGVNHESIVADAIQMNAEQRDSTKSLLKDNVSVITGPPGTGKSQVVVGALANMRLQKKSVLFTSRNHKAIDAVINRYKDRNERSIIVRCNSKEDNTINYSFQKAIQDILINTANIEKIDEYERRSNQLKKMLDKRGACAKNVDEIRVLKDKIGIIEEEFSDLEIEISDAICDLINNSNFNKNQKLITILSKFDYLFENTNVTSLFKKITLWIRLLPSWSYTKKILKPLNLDFLSTKYPPFNFNKIKGDQIRDFTEVANYIIKKSKKDPLEAQSLELPDYDKNVTRIKNLSDEIKTKTADLISLHLDAYMGLIPGTEDKEGLGSLNIALKNFRQGFETKEQKDKVVRLLVKNTPLVLKHFPCWAVTNLSVGTNSRIPLAPGIFDLSIIDEASQCDIPSAIPVLFRSKRASVVGDTKQLKHVSQLTLNKDSLIRSKVGLNEMDDLRFSYRETSLFDLFSFSNFSTPHFLRNTYRSCTDIAEYSNNTFYNGMLKVATNDETLKIPSGSKSGIHWTEVNDQVINAGRSGCVSEAEVDKIYELVKKILINNNFKGSLGVVTPFRQQQRRLSDRIYDGDIPHNLLVQSEFIVDTAHGFQGDEKDVMIFSLCSGPGMPQGSYNFIRNSENVFNVAVSRARAVLHVVGNRQWALDSGINHLIQLARPIEKRVSSVTESSWSPHESPWEKIFYEALLKKDIETVPQYPVSGRRLDLALVDKKRNIKIDIEVDSDRYHRNPDGSRKKDDAWRDIQLMGLGWTVKRFWVYKLRDNMDKCISEIEEIWR
jgi:very-short-patch-repair endonuclease